MVKEYAVFYALTVDTIVSTSQYIDYYLGNYQLCFHCIRDKDDGNANSSRHTRRTSTAASALLVRTTVDNKWPLYIILTVIYLCMQYIYFSCNCVLAKEIIIPFAYNSSESGSCHISHRNLIELYLVVVLCTYLNHSSFILVYLDQQHQ